MSVRTTHVGSLPRPADLSALLDAKEHGRVFDENDFAAAADRAVAEAVARQLAVGIDVVNDGEMARTGYATYVQDRLSGFSGDSPSLRFDDLSDFPDYRRRMAEAAEPAACAGRSARAPWKSATRPRSPARSTGWRAASARPGPSTAS